MSFERLKRVANPAYTVATDTSGAVVELNGSSITKVRKVSGSLATLTLYDKGLDGVYRVAQADDSGTIADMSWALTGNQPLRITTLGFHSVKFVGDAEGVIEIETTS